ncbi:exo-beta-1,3-glucanase [Umbelopsis sp. PMI_123]|nr:exo-beta-1,3-glucanase [Umbelopsis sp. PMI_123]
MVHAYWLSALIPLLLAPYTSAVSSKEASSKHVSGKCTKLTPTVNSGDMWISQIAHNGTSPFNTDSSYTVYRNVMDFGCKGDGVTDDTGCINKAIAMGNRCGANCAGGSSTISPALVYFPSGTYLITSPIVMYYYTQLVGNALNPPTLLMAPSFSGIALIDSDPYGAGGSQWYQNQNNFFRQVRNFVLDLTQRSATQSSTGIHWQVAQATSLTNLVFKMSKASNTVHQGVFMENGSGGFMSDLVFDGGKFGLWVGNQQFTSRNLTISNAQTAIYMNWNWAWTFKTLNIDNCNVGIDMSVGGATNQGVGSITVVDAKISNTNTAVLSDTSFNSQPKTSGSLILDNVVLDNVTTAVGNSSATFLAGTTGTTTIKSWGQGSLYTNTSGYGSFNQKTLPVLPKKSSSLLTKDGSFFERPRPQYEHYNVSSFASVKAFGAHGDGKTDDTAVIQKVLTESAGCKIVYFPAGVYIISNTVNVPAGTRIVGEAWSILMASGQAFSSEFKPTPMLKVGNSGDTGVAEISDIIFTTKGAQPGAILVQWNIRDPAGSPGVSGMWDAHFRIGGADGTELQTAQCPAGQSENAACNAAFMGLQLAKSSSAYLENVWVWTADHDLDGTDQLSIYTGRGLSVESANGPVWMYGTASEHNVLYQYQISNAKNVLMAMIQTETPYYQPVPNAPKPYTPYNSLSDPTFSNCASGSYNCALAWGLRIVESSNVYVYGTGLYNFFNNYNQTCLATENCQDAMVDLESNKGNVYLYNLNTKAATNMVVTGGKSLAKQADNTNNFCQTVNAFLVEAKA